MWHGFSQALRQLWRVCLGGEGAYRPDLHYMRGPGPKWHAKYGSLVQKAVPTGTPTATAACSWVSSPQPTSSSVSRSTAGSAMSRI